jgi:hypothetical protein
VTAPKKKRDTKPAKKVARKKPAKKAARSSTRKPAKKKVKAAKRTTKKRPVAKKPAVKPAPKKKRAARKRAPKRKAKRLVDDEPPKPTGAKKKKDRPKQGAGTWEVWKRLVQVEQLMSGGATAAEIISWCGELNPAIEKDWKVEKRHAEEYMRRVRDRWKAEEADRRPDRRREMRARLKLLYRTAMEKNKLYAAARALDLLCKLDGLYEPERIVFEVEDMADDEARVYIEHAYDTLQLIEEERERIGAGGGSVH